jgi:hypothetical protein
MALEIPIGADISQLKTKLAEAQILLENLRKQKATDVKLGLDTVNLQKQINDTKANINSLSTQIKSNASAMDNHSRATANGSNTLMQFSRIAQDAPFGIIGIGNNLTATAESFGHLAKSSGGAGNALKAVGASIMGSGGILLAVSLVTTGLTIMAQKGLTLSDVFNMISGNFDQAAQNIKKAYKESSEAALGEVASLKALISVAQDDKVSRRERLQAVKDIQKQYPGYFGNLTTEQIMYGDLTKQINNVSQALINKKVAEKISEKAGEAAFKELQLNAQLLKAKQAVTSEIKTQQQLGGTDAMGGSSNVSGKELANLKNIQGQLIKNRKEQAQYQALLKKFALTETKENANESDVTNAAAAAKARLAEEKRAAAERAKEAERQRKKDLEEQEKYNQSVLDGQNRLAAATALARSDQYNNEKEQRQKALDEAAAAIQAHEDFIANVGKTEDAKKAEQDQASYSARLAQLNQFLAQKYITQKEYDALVFEAAKNTNATLKQFDRDVYNLVTGSISDTFGQLGTVIGEALATGGNVLSSMGSALLAGLGKFISEMGGLLIQYGTMAVIKGKLDTAIAVGGPVAIAAGLGAIAVGVALKAIGGAIAAKAKGGVGGSAGAGVGAASGQRGSISTGADVSSPTSSVSSGGTFNNSGGTVVFEIAGQKLIGVLNNTTQGNLRLGGSGLVG